MVVGRLRIVADLAAVVDLDCKELAQQAATLRLRRVTEIIFDGRPPACRQ